VSYCLKYRSASSSVVLPPPAPYPGSLEKIRLFSDATSASDPLVLCEDEEEDVEGLALLPTSADLPPPLVVSWMYSSSACHGRL